MKISVIGTGSWGTALAQVLVTNEHEVVLYGVSQEEVKDINENHQNTHFFPEVHLDPRLQATLEIDAIAGSQMIVLAVPSFAIESVLNQIQPYTKDVILINVAKGFHPTTHERLSVLIRRLAPSISSVVSLIGPSHAEEVVIGQLTTIDAVSQNIEDAKMVQQAFSNSYLRIYTGQDEIGSELGAAIKNVMAIASGILAGLGYQDNTRAALITRGLQEMVRFGTHFGAQQQTFMGLTGIGDLIVTCSSVHSRNWQAGYQIGRENTVEGFFAHNEKTVEGVRAAKIVHELSQEEKIDMPICEEVYQILYGGKKPSLCASDLMLRELKGEFE